MRDFVWKGAEPVLAIGLMSGTSADGVDAALVEISGCGRKTKARQVAGLSIPYGAAMRERLLRLASGESVPAREFCLMNRLLGERFADACEALLAEAGVPRERVAFVGSHGHTFWHAPVPEEYAGESVAATLQLGDPSPISERLGCPVVSDFRARDVAAGGQGAPLVPYTDWLLFGSETENCALQNIGGIANISLLPAGGGLDTVMGFDTGPGNMVMDQLAARIDPALRCDLDGRIAASGRPSEALLAFLMDDPYYAARPPKTTGREKYGPAYVERLLARAGELGLAPADVMATACLCVARTIALACERFSPFGLPQRMVVSGGGARNPELLRRIRECLPGARVCVPEDLGWDGDRKEAVAFALLANECLHGVCNNAPGATGARHGVVMGQISC